MSSACTSCVHVPLVAMDHAQRVGRDDGHLVVGQIDDLVGVADQRRGVAGDEMLAVADADHQRAAEPGGDDHVGIVAEHDRQAVGAVQLGQRRLHGVDQRAMLRIDRRRRSSAASSAVLSRASCSSQATGDQVGDHFGVGRRAEAIALAFEPLLERADSSRSRRCGRPPRRRRRRSADGRWRRSAAPCVAQRVWPMPMCPGDGMFVPARATRLSSRPAAW